MSTACVANGQASPAANSAAPTAEAEALVVAAAAGSVDVPELARVLESHVVDIPTD